MLNPVQQSRFDLLSLLIGLSSSEQKELRQLDQLRGEPAFDSDAIAIGDNDPERVATQMRIASDELFAQEDRLQKRVCYAADRDYRKAKSRLNSYGLRWTPDTK